MNNNEKLNKIKSHIKKWKAPEGPKYLINFDDHDIYVNTDHNVTDNSTIMCSRAFSHYCIFSLYYNTVVSFYSDSIYDAEEVMEHSFKIRC